MAPPHESCCRTAGTAGVVRPSNSPMIGAVVSSAIARNAALVCRWNVEGAQEWAQPPRERFARTRAAQSFLVLRAPRHPEPHGGRTSGMGERHRQYAEQRSIHELRLLPPTTWRFTDASRVLRSVTARKHPRRAEHFLRDVLPRVATHGSHVCGAS